jgi:hypothetical protein
MHAIAAIVCALIEAVTPRKIVGAIVCHSAIKMATLLAFRARADKRLSHEAMDADRFPLFSLLVPQANTKIAIPVRKLEDDPLVPTPAYPNTP